MYKDTTQLFVDSCITVRRLRNIQALGITLFGIENSPIPQSMIFQLLIFIIQIFQRASFIVLLSEHKYTINNLMAN